MIKNKEYSLMKILYNELLYGQNDFYGKTDSCINKNLTKSALS